MADGFIRAHTRTVAAASWFHARTHPCESDGGSTVTQPAHENRHQQKKADSSSEQRWLLGGVPQSSDRRCHRESFHVFWRCQSATHTTHTCTSTQTQPKRGYIKQVSDLDDSLDVKYAGVGYAQGGDGAHCRSFSSAVVTRLVIYCFVA